MSLGGGHSRLNRENESDLVYAVVVLEHLFELNALGLQLGHALAQATGIGTPVAALAPAIAVALATRHAPGILRHWLKFSQLAVDVAQTGDDLRARVVHLLEASAPLTGGGLCIRGGRCG